MQITVRNHARHMSETIKSQLKEKMRETGLNENDVTVYLMSHSRDHHSIGDGTKLIIFHNTSPRSSGWDENSTITIGGQTFAYESVMKVNGESERYEKFMSDDGKPYAIYQENKNILYIPYNFETDTDLAIHATYHAMLELVGYAEKKARKHSWREAENHEAILKLIKDDMLSAHTSDIDNRKSRITRFEREIRQYQTSLKQLHDDIIAERQKIAAMEMAGGLDKKIVDQLNLILGHEKIKDVRVLPDRMIHVFTEQLDCYGSNGGKYRLGEFRLELNVSNSLIRFFGLTDKRTSYWSNEDPHPHVNGRDGGACLGNVSGSIAELCSQYELYALVLVLIDFLENANESDPAGMNVRNWDQIDEDGRVIRKGTVTRRYDLRDEDDDDEPYCTCENCGEDVFDEDGYRYVYTEADSDGVLHSEYAWCDDCTSNDATYDEALGEYVTHEVATYLEELAKQEAEA